MDRVISFIENIALFDIIFLIFIIYFSIQCFAKGFVLSLISFLKWILALIITIKLVPMAESKISDYIDMNEYVFKIGLGISIYVISLLCVPSPVIKGILSSLIYFNVNPTFNRSVKIFAYDALIAILYTLKLPKGSPP